MENGWERRTAQRARRDGARKKQPHQEWKTLAVLVRAALDAGHPLRLLGLVSHLIHRASPSAVSFSKSEKRDTVDLATLVDRFVNMRSLEGSALLAVLVHLLEDDLLRLRCRRELATRNDVLPDWLTHLGDIEGVGVVRMAHVLGDDDDIFIGFRLAGGFEVTFGFYIDHNSLSAVVDADVVLGGLDEVLVGAKRRSADRDHNEVEMSVSDARVWLEHGLERARLLPVRDDAPWPEIRPLVRWLIRSLPAGGERNQEPEWDSWRSEELFNGFFATSMGKRFDGDELRELLSELCYNTGTGDPRRWSLARVRRILHPLWLDDYEVRGEWLIEVPDLLRAYVPYAHVQSGIRAGHTAEVVAVIDELRTGYQQSVRDDLDLWNDGTDDDDDQALRAALSDIELRLRRSRGVGRRPVSLKSRAKAGT